MQQPTLKPLSSVQLSPEETTIVKWLRSTAWEKVAGPHDTVLYKTKVPEFYSGLRLYRMQTGGASAGSLGALEVLIKKLGFQGVLTKQELYPLAGHGNGPRHLTLKKADVDNIGVGAKEEDEE